MLWTPFFKIVYSRVKFFGSVFAFVLTSRRVYLLITRFAQVYSIYVWLIAIFIIFAFVTFTAFAATVAFMAPIAYICCFVGARIVITLSHLVDEIKVGKKNNKYRRNVNQIEKEAKETNKKKVRLPVVIIF